MDSSTVIRKVHITAMLVGPSTDVADTVAAGFNKARIHLVRVNHAAAACERLAVAMPQVVVVLGSLRPEERDAIADRATAVGAIVMYIDPELDTESLDDLVSRAARAALEQKMRRDAASPAVNAAAPAASDNEDVDSKW